MRHPLHAAVAMGGAVLLCAVLSACSHVPERGESDAIKHPTDTHAPPESREWQGRMSLLVDGDPPQHLHAAFTLQGNAVQGALTLQTPFGNAGAQAHWQPGMATLIQGEQRQHYASLDDMLRQTNLGATPVAALFQWLQGNPQETDGWQVDLSQHANGRINAKRQYPLPVAEIKIVVEQY